MKFVTLTNHRSGSSFFQRCLSSHPKIHARQEDIRKKHTKTGEFLSSVFSPLARRHNHVGIKVMYSHLNDDVWNYIRYPANEIKIIQLVRRDLLETALFYPHNIEGDIQGGLGPPLIIKGKVEAKIPNVIQTMKDINAWIEEYAPHADYTIYYEDDLTDSGLGVAEFYNKETRKDLLENFFGVEDRALVDLEHNQKKNKRPPREEIVTNYDELMQEIERQNICQYIETN